MLCKMSGVDLKDTKKIQKFKCDKQRKDNDSMNKMFWLGFTPPLQCHYKAFPCGLTLQ